MFVIHSAKYANRKEQHNHMELNINRLLEGIENWGVLLQHHSLISEISLGTVHCWDKKICTNI
jgi:hypothetical protein